jgi:molecular chaperone GrpE
LPKSKTDKIAKKLAKLETSLEDEQKKAEKYLNQLKYAKADLDNLQKQTQRRIDEAVNYANGRLITQLLPIIDELNLAIEAAKTEKGTIIEGLEMVIGKLMKLLSAEGVSPIEAIGKPFNPSFHEAVMEVEANDKPNGIVIEEFRKGYKFKDRVLRASMVKVARSSSSNEVKKEKENE